MPEVGVDEAEVIDTFRRYIPDAEILLQPVRYLRPDPEALDATSISPCLPCYGKRGEAGKPHEVTWTYGLSSVYENDGPAAVERELTRRRARPGLSGFEVRRRRRDEGGQSRKNEDQPSAG